MIKLILQNLHNRKMRDLARIPHLIHESFLLFMLALNFSVVSATCMSPALIQNYISYLTWATNPRSCFLLRLVMKDQEDNGATRKSTTTAQTCEAVSEVPVSTELLAEWSHMSSPSQPCEAEELPSWFQPTSESWYIINHCCFSPQSSGAVCYMSIDMGNSTISLWIFEAKRNVTRNLVLQNHWKYKMSPNAGVPPGQSNSRIQIHLITVIQMSGRYCRCHHHWYSRLLNLKAGDGTLPLWVWPPQQPLHTHFPTILFSSWHFTPAF